MPANTCEICAAEAVQEIEGHPVCAACYERSQKYIERVQARYERMRASADKAMQEAQDTLGKARQMASVIPFGQPIQIGHHSEGWDRRYRGRIEKTFRRGFRKYQEAKDKEERAVSAEKSQVISSDDPAAVIKMRERIAAAERDQEHMKAANAAVRESLKLPEDARTAYLMKKIDINKSLAQQIVDSGDRRMYAPYRLTNNGNNIRSMKQRLAELEAREEAKAQARKQASQQAQEIPAVEAAADVLAAPEAPESPEETPAESTPAAPVIKAEREAVDGLEFEVERNLEANRLRLHFPSKPDEGTRKLLRQNGFVWSPHNMAWQRMLNANGEWALKLLIGQLLRR